MTDRSGDLIRPDPGDLNGFLRSSRSSRGNGGASNRLVTTDTNYNNNNEDAGTLGSSRSEKGELASFKGYNGCGQRDYNLVDHQRMGKAPIVGWQDGSPTVFPSSPNGTPDDASELAFDWPYGNGSTPTRSLTTICRDSSVNTEDISSLANERPLRSTPATTIDRSVESLSPDKDTFLTTSLDLIGRSKDLSDLTDIISRSKFGLPTPSTDYTEAGVPVSTSDEYRTRSSSLTTTSISTSGLVDGSDGPEGEIRRRGKPPATVITTNPNYMEGPDGTRDSIGVDSGLDLEDELECTSKTCEYDDDDNDVTGELGGNGEKGKREKPKVPDGGWGWVVVFSSMVISMIADGVSFSFGLLYIEFLQEFGESKSKTSWIGSLFMAVPLLSGPVMSALVDRYGCRKMTILGGLVSGLGFILSCFCNTIELMYLTFGVVAGLGLGLCYVTAVVSIAFWFDKKRTLAVGLGACGTGIGTFVYAPMTTFFIEEYGWRGTVLLLAGTFFNMIVCGAVMRDPEWLIAEQRKNQMSPKKIARSECGGRSTGSPIDEFPGVEELRKLLKDGEGGCTETPEYLLRTLTTSTNAPSAGPRRNTFRSVVNLPTYVKESEKVPLEVLESLSSNKRLYTVILENYPSLLCRSFSDKKLQDSNGETVNRTGVTMSMRIERADSKHGSGKTKGRRNWKDRQDSKDSKDAATSLAIEAKGTTENDALLSKKPVQAATEADKARSKQRNPGEVAVGIGAVGRTDSLSWLGKRCNPNTHYFKDIRVHRNSVMYRGAILNLHKYRLRASSCPDIYRNSMTTLAKENEEKWYAELVDLLKGMMDFSMFLEFHFFLLSLSTTLLFTWFIVPYFYLAEHLTRNGYSEADAANLLSIIGITNTIGMVGLGWAGDQPWMHVSKTYTWCLVACGISTILMSVFTSSYILLMINSAAFGLFFASSFSFIPVIVVELIPLDRFTTAYGLCLLCQGIGNLLGPPLAGWIFDITGTWELSFTMAGSWIIVSGLLIGIIPYSQNRKMCGSGPMALERDRDCMA